jgi:2,3-bisphosphoglycerate-dependent phosphoglycerate mutase
MITFQDTYGRTVGFFNSTIEPRLKEGRNVLLVAHGNVLRCIISHLSGLSELEMLRLQVCSLSWYKSSSISCNS